MRVLPAHLSRDPFGSAFHDRNAGSGDEIGEAACVFDVFDGFRSEPEPLQVGILGGVEVVGEPVA